MFSQYAAQRKYADTVISIHRKSGHKHPRLPLVVARNRFIRKLEDEGYSYAQAHLIANEAEDVAGLERDAEPDYHVTPTAPAACPFCGGAWLMEDVGDRYVEYRWTTSWYPTHEERVYQGGLPGWTCQTCCKSFFMLPQEYEEVTGKRLAETQQR